MGEDLTAWSAVSSPMFSPSGASSASAWSGSNFTRCWRNRSSYVRSRARRSRSGKRRFGRRGTNTAGTHEAPDRVQLAQGKLRSHLTFRCWQRTQASTLCDLARRDEDGAGEESLCDMLVRMTEICRRLISMRPSPWQVWSIRTATDCTAICKADSGHYHGSRFSASNDVLCPHSHAQHQYTGDP